MARQLKRNTYEITNVNGQYELQGRPQRGFVASGGGAKGIYYAPLVKVMDERGMLKDITHVSGASAGAMTVSLLATGVSSDNFTKLVKNLDLIKLLDNQGAFRLRARGDRFRNIMEVIYIQQIKEHLNGIEKPTEQPLKDQYIVLKDKIKIFDSILKYANVTINSIDDVINLSKDTEALVRLDKAFAKSSKDWILKTTNEKINPRITFSDLDNLRSLLPEEKKHLIKKLSVTTTNQVTKEKQTHNVEQCPSDSISEIVQQSSAHPFLFTPAKNQHGHSVADGGIIDNMPSDVLLEQGLDAEEILCVKVEADDAFKDRLEKAQKHAPEVASLWDQFLDGIADVVFGGSVLKGRTDVLNREKIYHHLDNMIYLNSGSITTISTSTTEEERQEAIEDGINQCNQFFNSRIKLFDNPLLPMLYLGKEKLDATLLKENPGSNELFDAAAYAQIIFHLQSEIVRNAHNDNFQDLPFNIAQIHTTLLDEAKLNEHQAEQAMALILKQINYHCEGKLEHYLLQEIQAEEDTQKVGFFTMLLRLLYKPIEWIINLCCPSPTEEVTANAVAEPIDAEPFIQEEEKKPGTLRPVNNYTVHTIHNMFTVPKKPETSVTKTGAVQNNEVQDEKKPSIG